MRIICKNPDCPRKGRPFTPKRAGAQFCSVRCRVAAHRKQHKRAPAIWWRDDKRRRERKGAQAELAERLLGIAWDDDDDGGAPKTGRRYYYLALSHGYIKVDMSDTEAGKKSRQRAYARITNLLGALRKEGELGWRMVLDLTREWAHRVMATTDSD